MSLTDIMSGAALSWYPQVALILFLLVFGSVAVRTWRRRQHGELSRYGAIPLEDAPIARERSDS